ncbi:hypothetical protein [Chitinophaga sp. Cy-1792]|uniref:hypothetical protein n=1 Tax=Chitinophaga sp. Cy-1792 TaxID=2608339 RepID=UPI00142161B1|nr:hypothetical protein [Chitinophaga sp. Cy-1792]NIG56616.1 hypothetical protein [Chitinophaga sp. Cy-1792]
MKKLFFSLMLLLGAACTTFAATPTVADHSIKVPAVATDDSTYSVTVTVVAQILGLEVPINLAVVSSGLVGSLLTNLLGIAPPIDVKAGDIITVSAFGYPTKSFAFDPGTSNYINGNSVPTPINIKVRLMQ